MNIKNILFSAVFSIASLFSNQVFAEDWTKFESNNFIMYSNVKEKIAVEYIKKLENFNYVLGDFYAYKQDNHEKFVIYFLQSYSDLEKTYPKVDSNVAGFVKSCQEGITGFSLYQGDTIQNSDNLLKQQENPSLIIIFHEYSHIFMAKNWGMNFPHWFIEGYAEYYGGTRMNNEKIMVGMPFINRYLALKNNTQIDYQDIIGETLHLKTYDNRITVFYAQSWLLTHYIMSTPELRKKAQDYFNARQKGDDKLKAFERVFGMDSKALKKALEKYLNSEIIATYHPLRKDIDLNVSIKKMPKSASQLLLYDAALEACPKKENWEKLLNNIRKKAEPFKDDDYAQNILSKAEIIIGDEEKAIDYYKNRISINDKDDEAWFRYGQALYLTANHGKFKDKDETNLKIQEARNALLKAYGLNPLNATNLYYISLTTKDMMHPDDNSLNSALEAYNLEPSVEEFAFNAVFFLLAKENYEDAKYIIQDLASNPHLGKLSQKLSDMISAIDRKKSKEDIIKLLTN